MGCRKLSYHNHQIEKNPWIFLVKDSCEKRVVGSKDYYPYGKVLRMLQFDPQRHRLQGNQHDNETGLEYFNARNLETDLVFFRSIDPMVEKYPSLSPYNYLGGNPLIFVDTDGRTIQPINQAALWILERMVQRYGGFKVFQEAFNAGISQHSSSIYGTPAGNGVFQTEKDFAKHVNKVFRANDMDKLAGDQLSEAYQLYQAIQSSETIELEVVEVNESGTYESGEVTQQTNNTGLPAPKTDNSVLRAYSRDQEANNGMMSVQILSEYITGSGQKANRTGGSNWRFFEDQGNDRPSSIKGTIIIDASGQRPDQTESTFNEAIKEVNGGY